MNFNVFEKYFENFATYVLHEPILLLLFCLFTFTHAAFDETSAVELNGMPKPFITLSYSAGEITENSTLTVTISIAKNWHVNANVAADEFLKPSSIKAYAEGITFGNPKWPIPKEQYSEALDFVNKVFDGTFDVIIPIEKAMNYDSLSTNVTFYYQACSNICLAPDSVSAFLTSLTFDSKSTQNELTIQKKTEIEESNPPKKNNATLAFMLLLAFLGGAILNLMPCVLPVLSLKLFALIRQANESKKRLMLLGASTVFGVIISFLVLAGIVVIMRMAGGTPGWGMQFQSIGFLMAMVSILTLFSFSFFGVFEVWLPGKALTSMDSACKKEGLLGAFFTGALLVLLSTPCSAPMLGSAMGFAFNEPPPVLFLFFIVAGLGLSLPYIIVSVFPKMLSFLPHPGPWMQKLQYIMGILLLLTVAWLLFIAYRSYAYSGLLLFIAVFILNSIMAFVLGHFAKPGSSFKKELLFFAAIIVINICVWNFSKDLKQNIRIEDGYIAYSENVIENLRQNGSIVFLDVTADWCITCKANETAVLSSEELDSFFKQNNVQKVRADWTHGDKNVTFLLKSLGKSGVPAYAIYPKDLKKQPVVLSEILTVHAIKEGILNNR